MATQEKSPIENVKNRKTYNADDFVDLLLYVEVNGNVFGGYRQDLLVSPLNEMQIEFFVCHECNGVMHNACQIGEEQTPVCEVCVTEGVSSHPMMRSRKMIPELQAKCPLAPRGCVWNGTVCGVQEHLSMCPEFVVKCENTCDVILPRKELEEHLKHLCMKRMVECDHCRLSLMYRDLSQHYDVCLEVQLSCPNKCDVIVKRKLLSSHIDTDCPNSVVECPYRKFGCEEVMKRCELEDHTRVNEIVHLQSTTLFAVCKMEEMEKIMQQMEKKIITITKTLEKLSYPTVFRDSVHKDSFQLEGFALKYMFRPPIRFTVRWKLFDLRLNFKKSESNIISITITMRYDTKRSPLAKWPFEGRFKLTLIDRINVHESLVYESAVVKLRPEHQSFNEDEYPDNLKLAEIPTNIFLENRFATEDKIAFTIQVQETEDILIMESMEK